MKNKYNDNISIYVKKCAENCSKNNIKTNFLFKINLIISCWSHSKISTGNTSTIKSHNIIIYWKIKLNHCHSHFTSQNKWMNMKFEEINEFHLYTTSFLNHLLEYALTSKIYIIIPTFDISHIKWRKIFHKHYKWALIVEFPFSPFFILFANLIVCISIWIHNK